MNKELYVLVEWPECRKYMHLKEFNQCYYCNNIDHKFKGPSYFIPKELYETYKDRD